MRNTTDYSTRRAFNPYTGDVYENEGGGRYRCLFSEAWDNTAVFRNVASGWTFTAHGVGIYSNGLIDWDYSTGGRFE